MTGAGQIRWGILGTGRIAGLFAQGLAAVPDAALVAVGSRTREGAEAFGKRLGVPRRHGSYEALANDPDVDVIYVATPHPLHCENTLLCLRAGKAVLCEKPFAINSAEARAMVAEARARGLFLMEAMWSRFYPAFDKLRELLAVGAIGEVRMLAADLGSRSNFNPQGRLFDLALGGGALLDVGVYPVSLASHILGRPTEILSKAHLGETGVDEQAGILLSYPQGQIALLHTAIRTTTLHVATIMGTEGLIRLGLDWHKPDRITLIRPGREAEMFSCPIVGNAYNYEAAAVGEYLRTGRLESPIMPLDESIEVMETLDGIRGKWGLRYPGE
jgi:dihydrodiol dehydrogenase / D-xylose 1-dehydrogenase (NADP)